MRKPTDNFRYDAISPTSNVSAKNVRIAHFLASRTKIIRQREINLRGLVNNIAQPRQ
jgi:hypothetical protein